MSLAHFHRNNLCEVTRWTAGVQEVHSSPLIKSTLSTFSAICEYLGEGASNLSSSYQISFKSTSLELVGKLPLNR